MLRNCANVGSIVVAATPGAEQIRHESRPSVIRKNESVVAPFTRRAVRCDREVERPVLAVAMERVRLTAYAKDIVALRRRGPHDGANLPVMRGRKVHRQRRVRSLPTLVVIPHGKRRGAFVPHSWTERDMTGPHNAVNLFQILQLEARQFLINRPSKPQQAMSALRSK